MPEQKKPKPHEMPQRMPMMEDGMEAMPRPCDGPTEHKEKDGKMGGMA